MAALIFYELLKIYRKLRTYIGFGLIGVLLPLAYWGMSLGGEHMARNMTRGLEQNFLMSGNLFNGWFVANLIMNILVVQIPFIIVLVAGDIFAGEATSGTYRMLLSRPPSRTRIFIVKVIGSMVYTISLVGFLATISVGLGLLLFGTGDMLVMQEGGIAILPQAGLFSRFLLAYALAGWAMCVISALALFFSTIVENAIGPIVGSMAIVILFLILGNLPFDFFVALKPYLFTTYIDVWRQAFMDPIEWPTLLREAGYLGIFFLAFLAPAWLLFKRKDVLS